MNNSQVSEDFTLCAFAHLQTLEPRYAPKIEVKILGGQFYNSAGPNKLSYWRRSRNYNKKGSGLNRAFFICSEQDRQILSVHNHTSRSYIPRGIVGFDLECVPADRGFFGVPFGCKWRCR